MARKHIKLVKAWCPICGGRAHPWRWWELTTAAGEVLDVVRACNNEHAILALVQGPEERWPSGSPVACAMEQ